MKNWRKHPNKRSKKQTGRQTKKKEKKRTSEQSSEQVRGGEREKKMIYVWMSEWWDCGVSRGQNCRFKYDEWKGPSVCVSVHAYIYMMVFFPFSFSFSYVYKYATSNWSRCIYILAYYIRTRNVDSANEFEHCELQATDNRKQQQPQQQ